MPLARTGVWTVLWSKVLRAFVVFSAHIARPSSPELRTKVFVTREPVTPVWKLTASAIWSVIIVSETRRFFIGPSNHMPTLVWLMCRPVIVESLIAPPMALTWSVSMRSRTSPSMAKPDRCTLRLPPSAADLP